MKHTTVIASLISLTMLGCGLELSTDPDVQEPPRAEDNAMEDDSPKDCSPEGEEDPLNRASSGSFGPYEIKGRVCDGMTDEFSVNVSTGCTLQTRLEFEEDRRDDGALKADGDLQVLWYATLMKIGTPTRTESGATVTIENNPTDDSFGAVRLRVNHTGGEKLDYTLTVATQCP